MSDAFMRKLYDKEKIEKALQDGLVRKETIKAGENQTLTYILSDKKFCHHATLESAKAERAFLKAALKRNLRIYRVWRSSPEIVDADFLNLRLELAKLPEWNDMHAALDRVLIGAGY